MEGRTAPLRMDFHTLRKKRLSKHTHRRCQGPQILPQLDYRGWQSGLDPPSRRLREFFPRNLNIPKGKLLSGGACSEMVQTEHLPECLTSVKPHPWAQSFLLAGYQVSVELKQTDMKNCLGGNRDCTGGRNLKWKGCYQNNEP